MKHNENEFRKVLLESIFEYSNDAIMSGDLNGNFTSWNPAAERIYGYSAREIIGKHILILVPPDREQQLGELRLKIFGGNRIENLESVRIRKDGSHFPVSLTILPVRDYTGAIIGTSTIARDLTEQKRATQYAVGLASIVASSNDAITSFDLDGIITSWNPAAERTFGYMADEMIGRQLASLVTPENSDDTARIWEMVRDRQPVLDYETVRMRKDGSYVSISITVSPTYSSYGTLNGGSIICRDISNLKKAEQKFRDILESSPDAMIIVDKTGAISMVNSQTEKIFGYSRSEMLGQPVEILVPNRFETNLQGYRDSFRANPQVQSMGAGRELYGRRKDGHEIPVEVRISPIETADGDLVVATIHDVTEHRQLIRQLRDLNDLRNEFVAVVTHDLRSPMTSISGYAHLLIDDWESTEDDKKIEYLRIIVRNTEHLAQFVEDALQVARIEMGEYTFENNAFDICSLVQGVLGEAGGANINRRFEFATLGDIPLVYGDANRHWQVLTNLVSNAVKFSQSEHPVSVELSCSEDFVQIAITDQGIGIATEDMAKLFQKFGRVPQSEDERVPGNGLGLYICKNLVEAQGGQIWCESSAGNGSTFFYTIPIAQ